MPKILSLPLDTPHIDQVTNLDGVDYLLQFRYNQREERYYLSLGNPDGTLYVKSLALICNWHLGVGLRDPRLPPGMLMVVPQGTDDTPPKVGELGPGRRCELVYLEESEVVELASQ